MPGAWEHGAVGGKLLGQQGSFVAQICNDRAMAVQRLLQGRERCLGRGIVPHDILQISDQGVATRRQKELVTLVRRLSMRTGDCPDLVSVADWSLIGPIARLQRGDAF